MYICIKVCSAWICLSKAALVETTKAWYAIVQLFLIAALIFRQEIREWEYWHSWVPSDAGAGLGGEDIPQSFLTSNLKQNFL